MIGDGPIGVHVNPFKGIDEDGTVPSSNRSRFRANRDRRFRIGPRGAKELSQPRSDDLLINAFLNGVLC